MTYTHLNRSEREVIDKLLKKGRSQRFIAEIVGRNPSTISRKLTRNRCQDGDYDPNLACPSARTGVPC